MCMALDDTQALAQYRRDGYLRLDNVFTAVEMQACSAAFAVLAKNPPPGVGVIYELVF